LEKLSPYNYPKDSTSFFPPKRFYSSVIRYPTNHIVVIPNETNPRQIMIVVKLVKVFQKKGLVLGFQLKAGSNKTL
jgi:hypothetical protein